MTQDTETKIDISDEWSDEDLRDLRVHCLRYAAQSFGEEEDDCLCEPAAKAAG